MERRIAEGFDRLISESVLLSERPGTKTAPEITKVLEGEKFLRIPGRHQDEFMDARPDGTGNPRLGWGGIPGSRKVARVPGARYDWKMKNLKAVKEFVGDDLPSRSARRAL
jgi:hypothetical protein